MIFIDSTRFCEIPIKIGTKIEASRGKKKNRRILENFEKFYKFIKNWQKWQKKRANFLAIFKQKIELSVYFFTQTDSTRTVQRSVFYRSRRELSNAYLIAKFGFDTAENEPFKVR